jgi:hypothetical protein
MYDYSLLEVVKKLTGPVEPTGDASIDPQRQRNLENLSYLVLGLNEQLLNILRYDGRQEQSIKNIVKATKDHYEELFESLPDKEEIK